MQGRDWNHCCKTWGRLLQARAAPGDSTEMFICSRSVVTSTGAVQINSVTMSWDSKDVAVSKGYLRLQLSSLLHLIYALKAFL